MSEIKTGCNDSCPYYYKNTGCIKPESFFCPPQSITYEISYDKNAELYSGVVKSINNSTLDVYGNVNTVCEDAILDDLKVLEILKKYINIVNNGFTLCGNYYDEKDFKKEDFRKIKEWLENDYR